MRTLAKAALIAAHPASIFAAAWMLTHVGEPTAFGPHVLPVWPGIVAPSGVYMVGITLVLRDLIQRHVGKGVAFALILVGTALSAFVSPGLAVASGAAFLVAESVDFGTYTAIEKRLGNLRAILASNAVSIVVDSALFLWLAFGSLAFVEGQVIGKAVATLAAVALLACLRIRRLVIA